MVKQECGVGANKLLDQQRWRADFAGRVLDGRFVDAGAGVIARCGGQLCEVDRLLDVSTHPQC
jgi:hypothetical protein